MRSCRPTRRGASIDHHDFRPANDCYAPTFGITRDGLISALSAGPPFPVAYGTTVSALEWSTDSPGVTFSRRKAGSVRSGRRC